MDRRLFGFLSGWQFTVLALGAMLVPGALYAIPSFTNVAIEDAALGYRASVDANHRVYVFDPVSGYKNNPANIINLVATKTGGTCEDLYTVPRLKALVITSISGYAYSTSSGTSSAALYDGAGCSGNVVYNSAFNAGAASTASPLYVTFGEGLLLGPGTSISFYSYNDSGVSYIQGYLVPASALSPADMADVPRPKTVSAAQMGAKMRTQLH